MSRAKDNTQNMAFNLSVIGSVVMTIVAIFAAFNPPAKAESEFTIVLLTVGFYLLSYVLYKVVMAQKGDR